MSNGKEAFLLKEKQYLLNVCHVFIPDWLVEIDYFSFFLQNPNYGSSEGFKVNDL